MILDGKEVAKKVRSELAEKIQNENLKPKLAVILCGDDPASRVYVNIKSKACNEIGVEYEEYHLEKTTTQEYLLNLIDKLNNDKNINGILLQYPIPEGLNYEEAAEKISPKKDVDAFNPVNAGLLAMGIPNFVPCTPLGIMKLLEEYKIQVEGKKAIVIGRSNIVGKPMVQLLLNKNATVTVCHSKTKNLKEEVEQADIVIAAVGKRNIVTKDMVKKDAVVIDVGTNRDENGKLCGDVDFENVKDIASYITPNPGGVGPMTVAMLMNNIVKAYVDQNK